MNRIEIENKINQERKRMHDDFTNLITELYKQGKKDKEIYSSLWISQSLFSFYKNKTPSIQLLQQYNKKLFILAWKDFTW